MIDAKTAETLRDIIKQYDEAGYDPDEPRIVQARGLLEEYDSITSMEDAIAQSMQSFGVSGVQWVEDDGSVHSFDWDDQGNVKR